MSAAPYDLATIIAAIKAVDSSNAEIANKGEMIQKWIGLGATDKAQRNAALKTALERGLLLHDQTRLQTWDGVPQQLVPEHPKLDAKLVETKGPEAAGKLFIAAFDKMDGVHALPSGLRFRFIRHGTDTESPLEDTQCVCKYHGTLVNGAVFDSAFERAKPIAFSPAQVIASWKEMMQLMRGGDIVQIAAPPELAYGDRPNPKIPPKSTLVFTIMIAAVGKPNKSADDCDAKFKVLFDKVAADL